MAEQKKETRGCKTDQGIIGVRRVLLAITMSDICMYSMLLIRKEALCSEMSSSVKVKETSSAGTQWTQVYSSALTGPQGWSAELRLTFCNSFSWLSDYTLSSVSEFLQPVSSSCTDGRSSLKLFHRCKFLTLLGQGLCFKFPLHPIYLSQRRCTKIHSKWK